MNVRLHGFSPLNKEDMITFRAVTVASGLPVVVAALMIGLHNEQVLKDQLGLGKSPGFAVIELFTSEGCNTCPPADKLIETIQQDNNTGQIYILAFHVDYWDHQGWKDRFSDPDYTKRQQQYTDWFNLHYIYTPQIVVNGRTEMVGSDRRKVLDAISEGLAIEPKNTLTLDGKIEGEQITVRYQVSREEKNAEVVLALIQKSAESNVNAGENEGKSLSHVQVVRKMLRSNLEKGRNITTSIAIPDDFNEQSWEIIGFVQNKSNGRITAAARIDLKS